jgi:hypothetical protein
MDDLEAVWQEMVTTAFLGTERHTPVRPVSNGALADFLNKLDASDPEHWLLEAAAAIALYRNVGRLPAIIPTGELPACEPDGQDRCSAAAASRLATLLSGQYKELIPEWLSLAALAQKRVPEELLPDLLNWGENHIEQVDLLLPVLGKRGRWLAKRILLGENVAAAVFAESIPTEAANNLWQTGRKSVRRLFLRRLRKTDAELALSLITSTWNEESAEERTSFLETLKSGLSMADERFLESALDDRSKEVRKVAAGLLARLPDSRLVKRHFERARGLLKWKPGGFLRKPQLEISLPGTCDKEMMRDGIEQKPLRREAFGEKGWWLQQILSAIPPLTWNRLWDQTPAELLETAAQGDWKELLHSAWIMATINHPDPEWAAALLRVHPKEAILLNALPPSQQEIFLGSQFRSHPDDAVDTLIGYHHPWSEATSRQMLRHLRKYFIKEEPGTNYVSLRQIFHYLSLYLHPAIVSEAQEILTAKIQQDAQWDKAVEGLHQVLDFRQRMIEELR